MVHTRHVSYKEFAKYSTLIEDTSENINLGGTAGRAMRHNDSLIMIAGRNKRVVLVNNRTTNPDSAADYFYERYDTNLGQHVVYGTFYEWWYHLLIDQRTGDTTITCGEPVVSPDKKLFICGNSDILPEYTFNGFEVYENTSPPRLVCTEELTTWGPEEIVWVNDTMLYTRVTSLDSNGDENKEPEYLRLTLHEE